jgi:hypothetical protein
MAHRRGVEMRERHGFQLPWSVEELDACFVVRDNNGHQLGHIYFEEESGRRSAAKLLTKDEARGNRRSSHLRSLLQQQAL